MKLLFIFLIWQNISENVYVSAALTCTLTVQTLKSIYAPSTYSFDFIQATADTSGAVKLRVMFSAASSIAPPSTLTCTSTDLTAFNTGGPKCTVVAVVGGGYNVEITNILTGKNKFSISMPTIINPISARSVQDTKCQICKDTSCSTLSVQAFASKVDYTQDALQTYSVNPASLTTGQTNVLYTFQMITKNPIPINGVVGLQMPQVNVNYQDLQGAQAGISLIPDFYEQLGGTTPTIIVGTGSVGSSPDTVISIFQKYYTQSGNGKVYDELILQLNNTSIITALTQVTITISGCVNPPSTAPVSGWGFYSADIFWQSGNANYRYIDYGNTAATLTMTVPNIFQIKSPYVSTLLVIGSTLVSATGVTYRFTLQSSNDIPNGAKIYIYFPTSASSNCAVTYTKINCDPSCSSSTDVYCNAAQSRLEINDLFTSAYTVAPGPILFDLVGFTNPETTATVTFVVQSIQIFGNAYLIDQSTTAFKMTATTGIVTCTRLLAIDNTIYATTSYYLTLKAQHDINTDYKLYIVFPSSFTIKINSACITQFLGTSTVCVPDSVNNQIILSTFTNGTAIKAGTVFYFSVDSIQNPGNYLAPGTVIFNLTTSLGGSVDYGTWSIPPALYSKSNITSFSVTISDQTAGLKNAVYTISVTPKNRVAAGAYIIVYFPSQVMIPDQLAMSRDCPYQQNSGFSSTSFTCQFLPDLNAIRINDGFSQNASLKDPPTLVFGIPQVTNPRSLLTTDMFNISIFDQYGTFLYVFNNSIGPNVTMSGVSTPNYLNYVRTSEKNGQLNNYTFTFSLTSYIQDTDVFKFTLPSPIRFTDASKIYGVSYWIGSQQSANFSGDLTTAFMNVSVTAQYYRQLQKSFENENYPDIQQDQSSAYFLKDDLIAKKYRKLQSYQQIPANSVLDIMITNITSQVSLRPTTGSITFTAYTAQGFLIQGLNQGLTIINSEPTVISNATAGITPNYFERAKFANYSLQFKPINFEANMRILITVPSTIYIPDNVTCIGIAGVDNKDLNCIIDRSANTLNITNGFTVTTLRPDIVKIMIQQLQNPLINIVTSSFTIQTFTYDDYLIDEILTGLEINFYCVYPCRTCNTSRPTECLSCYYASDSFRYILNKKCLNTCPDGMYKLELSYIRPNLTAPTCDNCISPCQTCGENATQCLTCIPGFLLYNIDSSCYEDITWYFPFLAAAGFFGFVVLITDCIKSSTNFLHSYIFFLSWIECGVLGFLVYLYLMGQVPGDRSLSMISLGSFVFLNFIFIPVHAKLVKPRAPSEYQEIFTKFPCTSWFIQLISYLINFKMSLILISKFAGRPRFSGTFSGDSWQKFNMFGLLYIVLCYLAFAADFYLYFTKYGLRKLTSFIALEAVGVMTIICLILLLEIIQQCNCTGISDQDLNRASLIKDMKGKGKKKRRAPRSGMGNDDSYGSESDQYEQYLQNNEEDEYDEEEEGEEDQNEDEDENEMNQTNKQLTKGKTPGEDKDQIEVLEKLAKTMQDQSRAIEEERDRVLQEKLKLLEEKEKYFTDAADLKNQLDQDRNTLKQTLGDVQKHKDDLNKHIEYIVDEKLANRQGALLLPEGIRQNIILEKEEQQEGRSMLSAVRGDVSNFNNTKGKDASEIEFMDKTEDGMISYINNTRSMVDLQEMIGNDSQGGIQGNDLSMDKSRHATDLEFVNKSGHGLYMETQQSLKRDATDKELFDIGSGIYSVDQTADGIRQLDGTEIDLIDQRSADFGKISQPEIHGSQKEFLDKSEAIFDRNSKSQEEFGPHIDQEGRSEESSEGIVADHAPFKGIKDAMANQDKLRQGEQPPTVSSEEEAEEDNRPSARRRIKQVLYSDKSESSVDDMMEDTPSNYNIANGRLEGKSMGLKAVLLFAKNQELAMGRQAVPLGNNDGTLPQIAEEGIENMNTPFNQPRNQYRNSQLNSSGEQSNWRALNIPMGVGSTQIVGTEDFGGHVSRTVDHDMTKSKNTRSKRPEVQKQFLEPGEGSRASSHIQKNNFL